MRDPQEPQLLDHEADGIQELDNLLPRWWLWLFYISIVFSVIYMAYYHVFRTDATSDAEYKAEMAVASERYGIDEQNRENLVMEPSSEEAVLAKGQTIFMTHCVACHGANGEGLIGPNFTDDYFIHGPAFADSIRTVIEGVPAKGMISWKPILRPAEIQAVCSYIWTLRGTTPPNPKAPEGEKFEG